MLIFVILVFATLVILVARTVLIRTEIGIHLVWHDYAYREVVEYREEHGVVPEQLHSLRKFNPEYYEKMKYFPESWGKPDKILLQSESRGRIYITYGNGEVFSQKDGKVIPFFTHNKMLSKKKLVRENESSP